ncbi:MAG: hypothetical protein EWV40_08340 [Microcystis flos-aquae Mf_WU_F_19750830_S460]|uniref:Uncharacterized protein n=1 Tax=Microcystis flos-aquae Mf_WU_F_19750830_S460 TaxID=2486237 RepID=A0A552LSZ0_9CHRO|nr:MAG: hypothetical protein EWV40_08340 [Microcystis flos-aquae Mf_WU_F_19750830_S460]
MCDCSPLCNKPTPVSTPHPTPTKNFLPQTLRIPIQRPSSKGGVVRTHRPFTAVRMSTLFPDL